MLRRLLFLGCFALSLSPLSAAQAAQAVEDREAGIRLTPPPGSRFTIDEDGDWSITGGAYAISVYFDFEPNERPSRLAALQRFDRSFRQLYRELRIGVSPKSAPFTVGSSPAIRFSYWSTRGTTRRKGDCLFISRPGCIITMRLDSNPRQYGTHRKLFQSLVQSIQTFAPAVPNLEGARLTTQQLADMGAKLPVPGRWQHVAGDDEHTYSGREGGVTLLRESSRRYVPSDAQLIARVSFTSSGAGKPEIESEEGLEIHGWPGYVVRGRLQVDGEPRYHETLVVVVNETLFRVDINGPARYTEFLRSLAERTGAEWRFSKAGPKDADRPGEVRFARRELRSADLRLEVPQDWRGTEPLKGLHAYESGLGFLFAVTGPFRVPEAPNLDRILSDMMDAIGERSGGRAKIVARAPKHLKGFEPGELCVVLIDTPAGAAKGWIMLAPRNDQITVLALVTVESAFQPLKPTFDHLLETVQPGTSSIVRAGI